MNLFSGRGTSQPDVTGYPSPLHPHPQVAICAWNSMTLDEQVRFQKQFSCCQFDPDPDGSGAGSNTTLIRYVLLVRAQVRVLQSLSELAQPEPDACAAPYISALVGGVRNRQKLKDMLGCCAGTSTKTSGSDTAVDIPSIKPMIFEVALLPRQGY